MSEQDKKAYDSVNTDVTAEKMSEAMLNMLRGNIKEGEDFHAYIMKHFTPEECAYITAVHLAQSIKKMLEENPMVGLLTAMLRTAYDAKDEQKSEELLKKFKDILNKK